MKYNLNKLFPFLSIRTKLIVAFSLLSFIPLFVVGSLGIYTTMNTMEKFALDNLQHDVKLITERTSKFFEGIHEDLQIITNSTMFRKYLELRSKTHPSSFQEQQITLVMQQMITLAATRGIYYQFHFVDTLRTEYFNIQSNGANYRQLPDSLLNRSLFSFYFLLTDSLQPGEMAFFPAEHLDPAGHKIAALSFVHPVFDASGKFFGLFIADIFARHLFRVLETPSILKLNRTIAIVSSEGHYLYHSQKKRDWNRLLATRETESLFADFPAASAAKIVSGGSGILRDQQDKLLAYAPLFAAQYPGGNDYFLYEGVQKKFIFSGVRHFALLFIPLLLFFLMLSVAFGYLATSQLAAPVKKLQRGAQIISMGNYSYRLNIETNDEIEELALQFNRMAGAIHERELLLEEHQKKLERTVRRRTAELQGERDKLQAILDNVPSAFILIDKNNKILLASAAIERITRMPPNELMGKQCFEIYWREGLCDFCPRYIDISQARLQPRIRAIKPPAGDQIFIEHMTIPFSMNQRDDMTLEILTDVTERKKLENHLLKTEKLIATGEMSAVIAHEMRNSLTSVKMILQLQRENSVGNRELQAINVAIDSIHRMEEVLNDLLRFARPSPYDFKKIDLNRLLEESLSFLRPRLQQSRIDVQKNLQPDLPLIKADEGHLKDAIYNILINAIQAVDGQGRISVRSDLQILDRSLEDFDFTADSALVNGQPRDKIVLKKGAPIVLIEISDNGRGIQSDQLDKIFDPFFTTKLSGTGLGLAITRRVINQHGGIIAVNSQPARGTRVNIYLPS